MSMNPLVQPYPWIVHLDHLRFGSGRVLASSHGAVAPGADSRHELIKISGRCAAASRNLSGAHNRRRFQAGPIDAEAVVAQSLDRIAGSSGRNEHEAKAEADASPERARQIQLEPSGRCSRSAGASICPLDPSKILRRNLTGK